VTNGSLLRRHSAPAGQRIHGRERDILRGVVSFVGLARRGACRSCSSRQLPSLVRANTGKLADAERHVSECRQRCHRALFPLTRCGIARAGGCNEDSARAVWSLAFGRAVLFDVRGVQPRTRPTLRWTEKAPRRWYLRRREVVHLVTAKRGTDCFGICLLRGRRRFTAYRVLRPRLVTGRI
jgi:hypothetical protein